MALFTHRERLAAGSALLLLASLACAGFANAQNAITEEFNDVRNAVGLGRETPPIDFAERAPLVVPPTYNLPPPTTAEPDHLPVNDPDVATRRKSLIDPRRPVPPSDPGAAATGRAARTYLIDPPAGYRDPDIVAAGVTHDQSPSAASGPKTHKHHKKPPKGE